MCSIEIVVSSRRLWVVPGGEETTQLVTVTAEQLSRELKSDNSPIVLDVRWKLGDASGHDAYLAGHIPSAVFVDLDTELAAPPSGAQGGRHPLPPVAELEKSARRWGIDVDSPVVVYDDWGNLAAARLWWLLRWAGVDDVRLLDGGWGAWRAAGGSSSSGEEVATAPGSVMLRPGQLPVVEIDDVATASGTVLDARAAERYRGDVEPVDPRAGHIPGAISAPTAENLDADGFFRTVDELRQRFSTLGVSAPGTSGDGVDEVAIVYCGSGINAAHQIAAMAMARVPAALFPGSFSQWSSDQSRDVVAGPDPR